MCLLDGCPGYKEEDAEKYIRLRWWSGLTLGDILDRTADIYPEKEAVVDEQHRLTYAELREKTDKLALGLLHLGIKPTDRALLQLPNWHEFVVTYFALQKIGAIPVVLIARYRQYEINELGRISGAAWWFVPERFGRTDYGPIIKDVLRDNPGLTPILVRSQNPGEYNSFESLLAKTVPGRQQAAQILADIKPDVRQIGHMGPTGGTTGLPKIAPHTHGNFLAKVEYSAKAIEMNTGTVCLIVAPAAHDLPLANGILTTLFSGGKLILSNDTSIDGICRVIQDEKVNITIWVPTLTHRLINSDCLEAYDLSSLKKIYCGGGASSRELIQETIDKLGVVYLAGYGGTEGMLTQTRAHCDLDTITRTVGKPTCPYDTYKIIDEHGRGLPPGATGELVVKGPTIFTGYYNMPEENEQVFTKDGFYRTGDLAAIDESGYITLRGRLKDTIKRGGESIFAPEIEKLILAHPKVDNVAVVGMPDRVLGERICAYIQPAPESCLAFDDIVDFLKDRKASVLQLPEKIEFVHHLPLTPTGKIDKLALKKDLHNKMVESA